MNKIRKGDEVIVRTGKDKGRRGTVLQVFEDDRVLVEGINIAKKNKAASNHVSSGMQITGDRLEILNMQRNHKMNINIVDLEEEGLGKKGTRIEIFIPLEH